jgi:hypothetical protein
MTNGMRWAYLAAHLAAIALGIWAATALIAWVGG